MYVTVMYLTYYSVVFFCGIFYDLACKVVAEWLIDLVFS
jgi:hypothetical protein